MADSNSSTKNVKNKWILVWDFIKTYLLTSTTFHFLILIGIVRLLWLCHYHIYALYDGYNVISLLSLFSPQIIDKLLNEITY